MTKKSQQTFEDALARLEEIVKSLEGGKLSLDETVALYEEGIKLSDFCKGKLAIARNKVMMLVQDDNNMKEVELHDANE